MDALRGNTDASGVARSLTCSSAVQELRISRNSSTMRVLLLHSRDLPWTQRVCNYVFRELLPPTALTCNIPVRCCVGVSLASVFLGGAGSVL